MDFDSNSDPDTLLRVCKTCGVGVLSASEPERFKNCLACRAEKRATKESNRKASSSSSALANGGKTKSAKGLKKLEGKAKLAAHTKSTIIVSRTPVSSPEKGKGKGNGEKKKRGVWVFKSPGELYEELRSEGMDAHDGGCLLEFDGCFESVGMVGKVDNRKQVENVARELVGIDLLFEELVSQGRSYSQVDGSSHSTVYPCSCQPRGDCCGQIKVMAETCKVYDNGVACQKTSVRVYHHHHR